MAEVGRMDTIFLAENVQIDYEGLNFIIAHMIVGNTDIALGQFITVLPQRGLS